MKIHRRLTRFSIAGIEGKRPILDMEILAPQLGWLPIAFHIDTGTLVSIIPHEDASELRLTPPPTSRRFNIRVAGGSRSGRLSTMTVRFRDHPNRVFDWPCLIGDAPPSTGPMGQRIRRELPCLLGLAGFLSQDFDMLIEAEHFTLFNRHSWWYRHHSSLGAIAYFGAGIAFGLAMLLTRCRP